MTPCLPISDLSALIEALTALAEPHPVPLAAWAAAVPVPDALAAVLGPWLARCGCPWVIPGLRRSGPWTGGVNGKRAGDQLRLAGLACGVEHFTPHSLRHSLATHLAGHWGLSPAQIRLVLRHSSERTQGLYIHRDLDDLAAAVRSIRYDEPPPTPTPTPVHTSPHLRLVLV